jgi:hypothetical protein
MKPRAVIAAHLEALVKDAACDGCGQPLSRHGWGVIDGKGSELDISSAPPSCPDETGRRYEHRANNDSNENPRSRR